MPEAELPLARAYNALATRAAAGDPEAAQRLVAEVDACRGLHTRERDAIETELRIRSDRRELDGPYAEGAAHSLASFEDFALRSADEIGSLKVRCAGIGDARLGELGHWIYRKAELGDMKAAQRFASGSWIDVGYDNTIDDVAIEFWRKHAFEMAKRAIAGGELSASVEIAQAYFDVAGLAYIPEGGGQDFLGETLVQDPMRSAAWLRVATMTGYCNDCYVYAMQLESDIGGNTGADARAESERICATEIPGRCTQTNEYLSR
jgi:hypothetical protein